MLTTLDELRQAIVEGDDDVALARARAALEEGISPAQILDQAIVTGIEEAGRRWDDGKYFLPDVILSAGAFKAALDAVKPRLADDAVQKSGRIILGVVAGDMHDLGKTIVIAMLTGAGFEVIDLGVDVSVHAFVEKVKELSPDILGLGAYMTTTMLSMKGVIEAVSGHGLRDRVKIMVGGVPTSREFADEIGADAWGKDALDAVAAARKLMEVG